jgi:hypothetical protein
VNALTWDYSWWSARAPWLIFLVGYLPFFLVSFRVHDLETVRRRPSLPAESRPSIWRPFHFGAFGDLKPLIIKARRLEK